MDNRTKIKALQKLSAELNAKNPGKREEAHAAVEELVALVVEDGEEVPRPSLRMRASAFVKYRLLRL